MNKFILNLLLKSKYFPSFSTRKALIKPSRCNNIYFWEPSGKFEQENLEFESSDRIFVGNYLNIPWLNKKDAILAKINCEKINFFNLLTNFLLRFVFRDWIPVSLTSKFS